MVDSYTKESIDQIIAEFKDVKSGLLPALHAIDEKYKVIPEEALVKLSQGLNIPVSQIYGVATFYAKFAVDQRGKNVIRFCESAPCHIAGAAELVAAFEKQLGIKAGETTLDGKFTLEFCQCIGMCQDAPVFTINQQPYFNVSIEEIPEILARF